MKAHMDNFEEVMQEIAIKTEDKHGIVYYELKSPSRRKNIDVRNYYVEGKRAPGKSHLAQEVITPLGTFATARLAAEAHGITVQGLYARIKKDTNKENYYYGKTSVHFSNYEPKVRRDKSETT